MYVVALYRIEGTKSKLHMFTQCRVVSEGIDNILNFAETDDCIRVFDAGNGKLHDTILVEHLRREQ